MRISDWSSDVCSSDLGIADLVVDIRDNARRPVLNSAGGEIDRNSPSVSGSVRDQLTALIALSIDDRVFPIPEDRKSVVSGKSVSVRVDLGGGRIIKKKKNCKQQYNV